MDTKEYEVQSGALGLASTHSLGFSLWQQRYLTYLCGKQWERALPPSHSFSPLYSPKVAKVAADSGDLSSNPEGAPDLFISCHLPLLP